MRATRHRRLLGRPNRGEGDSIVTLSHKEIRERGLTGGGKGDGETLVMQGQEGRQGLSKIFCPSFHLIEGFSDYLCTIRNTEYERQIFIFLVRQQHGAPERRKNNVGLSPRGWSGRQQSLRL